MAKKKANKKVEKVKEELIDEEELIDLEDYEDDLDEEFLDDDEEEFEPKKKVKKVTDETLTLEERVEVMEKKLNVLLVLSVILTIVAVITMFIVIFKGDSKAKDTSKENTETQETEPKQQTYEYDVSKFTEISASDVEKESKNKTMLLYIGRSTCGYCIQYVPVLQAVQEKHSYTTYYLDIAKIYDYQNGIVLDSKAEKIMLDFKTNDAQKGVMNNFGSTPMTLVIKNGKIVDSIVGYVDEATLEKLVTDNGLN